VSLRSKSHWDINQVARRFGGGGHRNASGCTFNGTLAEAEESILQEMEKLF
jgi:bifunctional oligoribonuclease and PAP phosphatase NrnA